MFTCVFFSSDINECINGTQNCSQICTNTNGSFMCDCNSGYLLDTDKISCNGMQIIILINIIIIIIQLYMPWDSKQFRHLLNLHNN